MSTEESAFEVISNDFRTLASKIRPRKDNPIIAKLLEDQTLFIPITEPIKKQENSLNKLYEPSRKLGFHLNKRKVVLEDEKSKKSREGFMLWFTKLDQPDSATQVK